MSGGFPGAAVAAAKYLISLKLSDDGQLRQATTKNQLKKTG
jgi:hypothetical protein